MFACVYSLRARSHWRLLHVSDDFNFVPETVFTQRPRGKFLLSFDRLLLRLRHVLEAAPCVVLFRSALFSRHCRYPHVTKFRVGLGLCHSWTIRINEDGQQNKDKVTTQTQNRAARYRTITRDETSGHVSLMHSMTACRYTCNFVLEHFNDNSAFGWMMFACVVNLVSAASVRSASLCFRRAFSSRLTRHRKYATVHMMHAANIWPRVPVCPGGLSPHAACRSSRGECEPTSSWN